MGTVTTGIFTSPSGVVSYRWQNQVFHSLYHPEKEVERFLQTLGSLPPNSIFLLLGETLGYITRELKREFPDCSVVAVVPEESLTTRPIPGAEVNYIRSTSEFHTLLGKVLREDSFSRCRLVVWPPYRRSFPSEVQEWEDLFLKRFRMIQGSVMTQAHFGPRWLVNTLRNLQTFVHHNIPSGLDCPVVVAASGPSLEFSRVSLEQFRNKFFLLALPSSLRALKHWGIKPDAVMVTDGGYWSGVHLRYLAPETRIIQCPSAVFAPEFPNPRCFFSQDLVYENQIMGRTFPPEVIPSQGTVAASALVWSLRATNGPVTVLGLDLAVMEGQSHVRPHTFDDWQQTSYHRLRPWETDETIQSLEAGLKPLAPGFKTSPSLETYAAYFQTYRPEKTLFRIHAGARSFPGFTPLTPEQWKKSLAVLPPRSTREREEKTHDYGPDVRWWISRLIRELDRAAAGQACAEPWEKVLEQVWPLGSRPHPARIAELLKRNWFDVSPV